MRIAWIGTGIMGKSMLNRLAEHGHIIHAYNRTYENMNDLNHNNIFKYRSIREAISHVDLIMTMVGYPKDVLDVYLGDDGIIENCKQEQICVDFTTSSPEIAIKIFNNDRNIEVLDAPVTGGDIGAINGTLSIMVGGTKKTFDKVNPILKILGNKINYFGKAGNGQHAKLFNQILVGINVYSTAEVLNYCEKNGVDIDVAQKIFKSGIGNNWQLNNNGPKMLKSDLAPGFYIKHFIKDLDLVKENQKEYLFSINEVLKAYKKFSSEADFISNLGTQSIYEILKNEDEN